MLREAVLERVDGIMRDADFETARSVGCFDLIAQRDFSAVLKVFVNVDAMEAGQADDLKTLSSFMRTFPFVVGLRTRKGEMEENVVHERFGLPVVSPETLENIVHGSAPRTRSESGGCFVGIDGSALRQKREELGFSLGRLASAIGVSKKSLLFYERGGSARTETATRLEDVLGAGVSRPLNMFKTYKSPDRAPTDFMVARVEQAMQKLGLRTANAEHAPFDVVAKTRKSLFLTAVGRRSVRHAAMLKDVSDTIGRQALFVLEKSRHESVDGVPALGMGEFGEFSDLDDFLDAIEKRVA